MHSIAIDGPSGAGKSTLAKRLADYYGWNYVDTGAVYRAVGLACRRAGVDPCDETSVAELILPNVDVSLSYGADGRQITRLNGEDVSAAIRADEISRYASDVSALASVRKFLLELQRDMAATHNVVMDGRDIGTVVLQTATVKIFLTAQIETRAKRRWLELRQRGEKKSLDEVLSSIRRRDANDEARANAPLYKAEDAILLDNTDLDEDAAFASAVKIISEMIKD
ncbi:MAG: (d)CMP kinase [Oscillospiraceae bacterium]|jgi:cytidylate kinase|nr:(d)CMP kinase [Oscillospiraceae bacterium]